MWKMLLLFTNSFTSKEQDINHFFQMSSPVLQAPWCLRKHERSWFTITLGKLPVEFWGQETKKKITVHTPRTFHTTRRINKQPQKGNQKQLVLSSWVSWWSLKTHTNYDKVLEKSFKKDEIDLLERESNFSLCLNVGKYFNRVNYAISAKVWMLTSWKIVLRRKKFSCEEKKNSFIQVLTYWENDRLVYKKKKILYLVWGVSLYIEHWGKQVKKDRETMGGD